jgi:hypothetical protein
MVHSSSAAAIAKRQSQRHDHRKKSFRQLTCESFEVHVHTLVTILIPTSGEEVNGVVQVKVVVTAAERARKKPMRRENTGDKRKKKEREWRNSPVEMPPDEIVNLFFVLGVQVLELVDRAKLLDIETVRRDSIFFFFFL